jgi:hypothetical protein
VTERNQDAALVARLAAETLATGAHPITAFVALYALSLCADAAAIEVTGKLVRRDAPWLKIEIRPAQGCLKAVLGRNAEILESVRAMARRMARPYGLYVEIHLRRPRKLPTTTGDGNG